MIDISKVLEFHVSRTTDYANDTAKITVIGSYSPYKLYDKASITYKGISFDGIVAQIEKRQGTITYTLSAPSIILTRSECDIALEDEMNVVDAVKEIVPDEFEVEYDGDETYSNSSTIGQVVMDVLKDIATSVEKEIYISGWKIIFGDRTEPKGNEITLSEDDFSEDSGETFGGSGFFTKVKGYFFNDEEETYEEIIYDNAAYFTVDIINSEEEEDIETFDQLKKKVHTRANEIRSDAFPKIFHLLKIIDVKPFDVLVVNEKRYKVLSVNYNLSSSSFDIEVKTYEIS